MLSPFATFAWSAAGGKYIEPFVRIMCDWQDNARYGAALLNQKPKGHRVVLFQGVDVKGQLFHNPNDRLQGQYGSLWWPNGIAATRTAFKAVLNQLVFYYKGPIDLVVFDIESGRSAWTLTDDDMAAIYADPRYKTLAATGRFPADCRKMNVADRCLFNYGCGFLFDVAMQQAIIKPLYEHYNGVDWCQFADGPVLKTDAPFVPDANGNAEYHPPSSAPLFAPSSYGITSNLGRFDNRFRQPWYVLAWGVNTIKASYRAKPGCRIMPWLAARASSNVWDNTWWQESVFHTCCLSGPNILYFNADDPSAISNWRYDNAVAQYVSQTKSVAWKNTLITDLTSYDKGQYVVSAARLADNSVLGRISFKPGINSAKFSLLGKQYTVNRPADGVGAWFHS